MRNGERRLRPFGREDVQRPDFKPLAMAMSVMATCTKVNVAVLNPMITEGSPFVDGAPKRIGAVNPKAASGSPR